MTQPEESLRKLMTEQMWEKVSQRRGELKVGSIWMTEQGGRGGTAGEGGKHVMERQKCGSCENVKEKCVMIKEEWRAGWNLPLQKDTGTAVNKESDCEWERDVFQPVWLPTAAVAFLKAQMQKWAREEMTPEEGEFWENWAEISEFGNRWRSDGM